jgi:integrase
MTSNAKTRTGGEPKREPKATQGSARGVRRLLRPGRPNPYGVQWRERIVVNGALKAVARTLFFPTAATRDAVFHEKLSLRRAGMLHASVPREEIEQWRAFKTAVEGTPWQVVVAGWRENLTRAGRQVCTMTVDDAVKDYLARMKALRDHKDAAGNPQPKLGSDTFRQKDHKLKLFAEQFGALRLDAVPAAEIETWADDFDEVQSDVTFDNYVKHVSALYGYFIEKRIVKENPCAGVNRRSDGVGEVGIITPEQTAQLFHTALTYVEDGEKIFMPVVGRLALEAFCGLRFSSGCRIQKSEINFEDRGILLPRRKLKTGMVKGGRRHYIDDLPAQVWEWLAIAPAETWVLKPRDYMGLKSLLFRTAGVPHPHNCLRHGFATYHVAALKNPGRTATILCHTNQELLWAHYNGIATQAAGLKYQSITPQTAAQIAASVPPDAPEGVPARRQA